MEEQKGYCRTDYRIFHLKDHLKVVYEGHYHDFHKLLVVIEGEVVYKVEGQAYTLIGPCLLIVPSFRPHSVEVSDRIPYKRMMVYMQEGYIKSLEARYTGLSLRRLFMAPYFRPLDPSHHLLTQVSILEKGPKAPENGLSIQEEGGLLSLLATLIQAQEGKMTVGQESYEDPRIGQILDFMNDHLKDDLSVKRLAGQVYMSPYYFMRLFKEATGYGVHEMVLEKRLIAAQRYYQSGHGFKDSAYEAGFKDYSTFLRAFKKRHGMSPRAYYEDQPVQ